MGMKENPFAEAALMEIDLRLDEVAVFTKDAVEKAQKCLDEAAEDGMIVTLLRELAPTQFEISHATEYSSQLVKMMIKADNAFRYVRTAHSSGYMETDLAKEFIRGVRRKCRMVFDRISLYAKRIDPMVSRDDIKSRTAPAKTMIEKMGMPNKKILNREASFRHKRISELGT